MSDKPNEATQDAPADEAPADPNADQVLLDEWCAERSMTDRRVELLAVFHHREQNAGRLRDSRAAYARRYAQTESKPTT